MSPTGKLIDWRILLPGSKVLASERISRASDSVVLSAGRACSIASFAVWTTSPAWCIRLKTSDIGLAPSMASLIQVMQRVNNSARVSLVSQRFAGFEGVGDALLSFAFAAEG